MKIKKKNLFIYIGIFIVLLVSFLYFFLGTPKFKKKRELKKSEKIIKNKEEKIEYSFFYPADDGEYLLSVKKKVIKKEDLIKQIREVVLELFKGPPEGNNKFYNPFSDKLKLNELYVVDNSIAVIDVNDAIHDKLLGGSDDELLTIYSIVNTLSYNFPFIRATQIIINGREAETLAGHIDISHPVRFDSRWIRVTE